MEDVPLEAIEDLVKLMEEQSPFRRSITFDVLHNVAMSAQNRARSCFERRKFVAILVCRWGAGKFDPEGRAAGRRMHDSLCLWNASSSYIAYGNYSSEPVDSLLPDHSGMRRCDRSGEIKE
jgi:hypothetical protein